VKINILIHYFLENNLSNVLGVKRTLFLLKDLARFINSLYSCGEIDSACCLAENKVT
jgi:hypothetical protein